MKTLIPWNDQGDTQKYAQYGQNRDTGCQRHPKAEKERLISGDSEIFTTDWGWGGRAHTPGQRDPQGRSVKTSTRHNWVESCTFRAIYTQNKSLTCNSTNIKHMLKQTEKLTHKEIHTQRQI